MGAERVAGWLRGGPVLAVPALTAVAFVAATGSRAAAAGLAAATAPVPGAISTVAGGVGGPAMATKVPVKDPCGVGLRR